MSTSDVSGDRALLEAAAKERPILFSAPMVCALLAGTKTQTRRAIKTPASVTAFRHFDGDKWDRLMAGGMRGDSVRCPYGKPGERLWVRESFWGCDLPGYGDQPCIVYADEWHGKEYKPAEARPWARKFGHIPGIHMPRDTSRITLEITDVRVERLQAISDADAIEEGVDRTNTSLPGYARERYGALWESINGPDSWDANPFVWAVSFKRAASLPA